MPLESFANCEVIAFDGARDEPNTVKSVAQCSERYSSADVKVASLLGYIHRHGYGVPRSTDAASRYFQEALSAGSCEPYAYCGLKGLATNKSYQGCAVDCGELADQAKITQQISPAQDAKSRAYELLAELLESNSRVKRTAEDLQDALNAILAQEEQLRNEAYQELCTGHLKRAVVTVSVAFQLSKEMKRRDRLVQHHELKVKQDGNARSQAALLQLESTQKRAAQDKRVFFEKYAKSVFSASNCDETILSRSYVDFGREIAQVDVTELEQSAYRLFQEHVEDARESRGMNSVWFDNLDELLTLE